MPITDDTYDDSEVPRGHTPAPSSSQLVIAFECDRPLAGGARYALDNVDLVTIGRGGERRARRHHDGELRILDVRVPGRSLSAAHARLVRVGPSWALEDTGSTNGTFVRGERITRTVLHDDDFFDFGHVIMRVNPSLAIPAGVMLDADVGGEGAGTGHVTLDPSFAADLERAAQLVASGVPVVVTGESGTGKEVLARWLHDRTGRSGGFVAVNCGAIPATLVESQLFGHVKGAFSGAVRDERGLVRAASGGTLFLDEIADLPKQSQAALLRVLQEGEVMPVGSTEAVKVDLRVVAATHQPLEELVARSEFRRDLFARIAGFIVTLPPLRERRDDLGILVASLLKKIAGDGTSAKTFSADAGRALVSYSWPLNIRELERCIATCVALARDGRVKREHLPASVANHTAGVRPSRTVTTAIEERDERLRMDLLEHLSRHRGNIAAVARGMGKAPMQIHRWCRRFGIDPRPFRG